MAGQAQGQGDGDCTAGVAAHQEPGARQARGGRAYEVAVVKGVNYSKGDPMTLRVYMAPIRELQP